MKIIILGAGQVGGTLAEQLADESVPLKLRRLTTAAGRLVPEA